MADAPPGRLLADLAPPQVLNRLELTIVRRLEGYLRGEHLGLLPGPGTELAEAREYQPGEDDVRHMDWAVTARTTVPHVRDVIADRELETYALIDLTASMHFGTALQPPRADAATSVRAAGWEKASAPPAAWDKRDLAVAAVATIGTLTARLGDRFGGYVLTDAGMRRHPARSGRSALYGMVRSMLTGPRMPSGIAGTHGPPSLGEALQRINRAHPRRGLRVVVSDFLEHTAPDDEPTWLGPVQQLALRHQVLAVEIVDPREGALPDVGVIDLMDPETGQVMEIDTHRPEVRSAFEAQATAHRDRVRTALRQSGCAHLVLSTDSDWVRDTARFVLAHRHHAGRLHRPPQKAR